ncbi:MAG: hypothetical protein A2381_20225 [Bdellovibrionales bacterium RIFOXYB1_FULL_37_110]|nr:MAG: hypothetical protein A2181_03860 [Bdellovibrionales bacterium RIFOXYA1_FULL_38_20]OFZ51063.1 MAG: hypothetical protein A2417_20010 [Bdellovibrionales bacterium RIFOXYC1_FULL_37_79]OFZ60275.1 MAG: hypothetical protein A2381_20225 [Bdellovibrionales bacterium RIFOXYB1_FULL_37_110]OFZ63270.1 MAG: hypothetical protein A2577_01540 [Bdellovibrionales bacterium RIFOXYD1_FULL_36_51]
MKSVVFILVFLIFKNLGFAANDRQIILLEIKNRANEKYEITQTYSQKYLLIKRIDNQSTQSELQKPTVDNLELKCIKAYKKMYVNYPGGCEKAWQSKLTVSDLTYYACKNDQYAQTLMDGLKRRLSP